MFLCFVFLFTLLVKLVSLLLRQVLARSVCVVMVRSVVMGVLKRLCFGMNIRVTVLLASYFVNG